MKESFWKIQKQALDVDECLPTKISVKTLLLTATSLVSFFLRAAKMICGWQICFLTRREAQSRQNAAHELIRNKIWRQRNQIQNTFFHAKANSGETKHHN